MRSGKQVRYKKQMVFVACYTGVVVGSWIHKSRGRPKEKKLSFAEIDFVQHDLAIDNLDRIFTVLTLTYHTGLVCNQINIVKRCHAAIRIIDPNPNSQSSIARRDAARWVWRKHKSGGKVEEGRSRGRVLEMQKGNAFG